MASPIVLCSKPLCFRPFSRREVNCTLHIGRRDSIDTQQRKTPRMISESTNKDRGHRSQRFVPIGVLQNIKRDLDGRIFVFLCLLQRRKDPHFLPI
jgi:hypothetical protein